MSGRDIKPKKKSRHKEPLEPISMEEILAGAGMSGFVSILDPPEEVPRLQALVDDIRDIPLLRLAEERLAGGREPRPEAGDRKPALKPSGANIIHLRRRGSELPAEQPIPAPVPGPEAERVPGIERDTGPPRQHHVRRAVIAQDGHSSGEEMLYQSLWNSRYTTQETRETKLVTIGWKAMAKMARLTPRNTKKNCQSLITKLAIEQLSDENSRESIGRTYRLFSYKAILERRRA